MATLILTAVGTAVGGPLGGLLGSFLGATIDRGVFGNGRQNGARSGNLAVQSAAYGEPIPRLYGRMRIAGNLIWSPGIRETQVSGGGKARSGSNYRYSASFAVALAARPIADLGRIWADGKLLRRDDGSFTTATTLRLYHGSETQTADPLIVAAEGVDAAPAYRGIAYAVFEDLPLADFGNRIPNLTFEVIADTQAPDTGTIAADLFAAAGIAAPQRDGVFPTLHGFAARHAGDLRSQLDALLPLADMTLAETGALSAAPLRLRSGAAPEVRVISAGDLGATPAGEPATARCTDTRGAATQVPDAVAIGFFDPARDYQLGLQRVVRRTPVVRGLQLDVAVAMAGPEAKALAARRIGAALAQRCTAEVRLPWRHADLRVGDSIIAGDDVQPWRIRSIAIEALVPRLTVERLPFASPATAAFNADSGRGFVDASLPNGPTTLELLDLPPLPGALPVMPRLWIAAAGPLPGWRNADIEISSDDGESYQWLGTVSAASVMGAADTVLGAGSALLWDMRGSVDVSLLNAAMWLDSRAPAAVLAGANLALLGDELIQFSDATPIAPGRFRLSGLLRGRRGTEAEIGRHVEGERFVLIDPTRLLGLDPPVDALGRTLLLRASHRSGAPLTQWEITPTGRALQPLAPVHLQLQAASGGLAARWVRRSRAGFGWADGADAPLAEDIERYQIELWHAGQKRRTAESLVPSWDYTASARAADDLTGPALVELRVRQMSTQVGAGATTTATLQLA